MNKVLPLNYLKLGFPFLILSFLVFLSTSNLFYEAQSQLSIAILLDLVITIPIVYYLIIRNSKIPNFTIVYSIVIGLVVAGYIIPEENQELLSKVKLFAIPAIEVGILSLLIYKIRNLRKTYTNINQNEDFYDRLLIACNAVFPGRVGKVLATEVAVFYYLFAGKQKKKSLTNGYTYFKKSGIRTTIGVFLMLILTETIIVHVLVEKWNPNVAWVLTFIGTYTMFQIISILISMSKRLINIDHESDTLILRYGFGCQTSIPFSMIDRIEKSKKSVSDLENYISLSLFDILDSNNLIIHLKGENILYKIYGIEKKYKSISLFVDDIDQFVSEVEKEIVDI